ncbi:MAG: hypothetical protein Q7R35_08165 [Elusimicrobiota bacterium]|nr:hypothetical protein [Elusimicrobiota bacterium]
MKFVFVINPAFNFPAFQRVNYCGDAGEKRISFFVVLNAFIELFRRPGAQRVKNRLFCSLGGFIAH